MSKVGEIKGRVTKTLRRFGKPPGSKDPQTFVGDIKDPNFTSSTEAETGRPPSFRGGGGGGSGGSGGSGGGETPSGNGEAQRQENLREINRQTSLRNQEANRRYNQDIRNIKNVSEKQKRFQELNKELRAIKESGRVAKLQKDLSSKGAQTIIKDLIEKGTGDRIRTTTTINQRTGERIFTRENLTTGQIKTKTFERPKGGGGARQTGGIIETPLETKQLNIIQKDKQINYLTGQPYSIIDVAPSLKERYKETIKKKGHISGSISFPFQEAGKFVKEHELKQASERGEIAYQPQATERLISEIPKTGIYFTGVGAPILFGESVEELATPSGRERLKGQSQYLQTEKGYSPLTSDIISYGQPVVFGTLGALGVRRQVKGVDLVKGKTITEKDIQNLQKAKEVGVGVEFVKKTGDTSILRIISRKEAGRVGAETRVEFELRKVKGGYQIESGRGTQAIGKQPLLFRDKDVVTKQEFTFFGEAQPTKAVKVKTLRGGFAEKKFKLDVKEKLPKKIQPFKGRVDILGLEEEAKLIKQQFVGFGRQEKEFVATLGKKISKARVPKDIQVFDPKTGKEILRISREAEAKAVVKPKEFESLTFIKKIEPQADTGLKISKKMEVPKDTGLRVIDSRSQQQLLKKVSEEKAVGGITGQVIQETQLTKTPLKMESAILRPIPIESKTEVVKTATTQLEKVKEEVKQAQTQINLLGMKQVLREKSKQTSKQITKQITESALREEQALKSSQVLKSMQKLLQKQKQTSAMRSQQITQQATKQTTKPPLPIIPLTPSSKSPVVQEAEEMIKLFTAFAKKKGEDVKIGTFETKAKAEKKLRKFLAKDISASGIIVKEGKKQRIDLFGRGWRPSKKETWRIVERRSQRLDTPQEVFQIKQARKRKTRKNKNSWF